MHHPERGRHKTHDLDHLSPVRYPSKFEHYLWVAIAWLIVLGAVAIIVIMLNRQLCG